MDNHPIPQDITGFKFKLFGPMTVKQFAYLAVNVVIAWFFYILPLSVFVKVPLEIGFVLFGVSLAFLPVAGRPMDVMIKNFFIAVFNPTKYVYQKDEAQLANQSAPNTVSGAKNTAQPQKKESMATASEKRFGNLLNSLFPGNKTHSQEEMVFLNAPHIYPRPQPAQTVPGFVPSHAPQATSASPQNQPTVQTPTKSEVVQKQGEKANNAQKPAEGAGNALENAKIKRMQDQKEGSKDYVQAHQKVLELQNNLSDALSQKQQLEDKLVSLQRKLENQQGPASLPSMMGDAVAKETSLVRSVPNSQAKNVGFATTPEYPNIIIGIIKDPRGNPLPNILVEVKDKEGNAVRAFKTNPLGQFASATPLVNGDYVIEFEDPRGENKFDSVSFKASGEIILPIEVISVDTREELRRSLFN